MLSSVVPSYRPEGILVYSRERCPRRYWETLNDFQNLQAQCFHATCFLLFYNKRQCSSIWFGLFPVLLGLDVLWNEGSRKTFAFSQKNTLLADLHLDNQTNNVLILGYLEHCIFWKQMSEIVLYLGNFTLRAIQIHLGEKQAMLHGFCIKLSDATLVRNYKYC